MDEHRITDEDAIAEALGDLEMRRARGEAPSVFEYRDRLGESHTTFLEVLEAEAVLDEILDPPPQETFPRDFGPYTLLREVGRGATGVVYEGVHRHLGRRAAIKVLRRGFDADPESRDRFRREMRLCAQVRHPHVVEVLEAGEVEGRAWYAMTLVEGRTLAALIKSHEAPEPKELARAMAGVADALDALHRAGVVHRDVKPANLVRRATGEFVLVDFGHARAGDGLGLTLTGETLGTPQYMSPEQLVDAKGGVDGRSDVYALGATLYEALSGRAVFPARDLPSLTRMILEERPEPLRRLAPHVPAVLEGIVMKAIEKRPDDRQESAARLRDELRAFAEGGRVRSRPVGTVVRFGRFFREHALPLAAAVVVALGGAWLWTHRPATFRIDSVPPGAEVLVASARRGTTPAELSMSPGAYDVTLRKPGFVERTRRFTFGAGDHRDVEVALTVEARPGGGDFAPRDALFRSVGLQVARMDPPSGLRGGGREPTILWPRKDVRLEDLADWAVEVPGGGPADYVAEFVRNGQAEPFHTDRFASGNADTTVRRPFPAQVRDALREGDEVRCRVREEGPRAGDPSSVSPARFRVVRSDAADAVAAAERRVGEQPPVVLAEMRLRILEAKGLRTAALRLLEDLPGDVKEDARVLALASRLYEDLGLADTARARETGTRLDRLPKDVHAAIYRPER